MARMTTTASGRARVGAIIACLLVGSACGSSTVTTPAEKQRTCLVLSVGADKGVAELGAIAALKQMHIPIDCVVGNSMGSIVGSLYATDPGADTGGRYRELMSHYKAQSLNEGKGRAAAGTAIGGLFAWLSGGASLVISGSAFGGAKIGAASTPPFDITRLEHTLDSYYRGIAIERLSVPFATMYEDIRAGMADERSGNLARAVSRSVANPLIFKNYNPAQAPARGRRGRASASATQMAGALDPGVDRMAAIPVDDACRMFPHSRIIAINVSGQPVLFSARMDCPLIEVDVPVTIGVSQLRAFEGADPDFSAVVDTGYRATLLQVQQALAHPSDPARR